MFLPSTLFLVSFILIHLVSPFLPLPYPTLPASIDLSSPQKTGEACKVKKPLSISSPTTTNNFFLLIFFYDSRSAAGFPHFCPCLLSQQPCWRVGGIIPTWRGSATFPMMVAAMEQQEGRGKRETGRRNKTGGLKAASDTLTERPSRDV